MKKIILTILSISFLFVFVSTSSSITLNYLTQPGDDGPGGGFLYTLTYNKTENIYDVTFQIVTPGGSFTTDWYAGWFTFKFVPGDNAPNLTIFSYPTDSGSWVEIPPIVDIYGGNNIGQGGRSGFYVSSLETEDGQLPFPYSELICLTGSTSTTYNFTFKFTTDKFVFVDEIPFQVGFYDGQTGGGKVITGRLSKTLAVPEPGILMLLGLGLMAVGVGSRWMRKKK